MMQRVENATFTINGEAIRVKNLRLEMAPPFDHSEPGVRGFSGSRYEIEFTMDGRGEPLWALLERRRVLCRRCGLGRIYSSERRALKAMASRWARHVCPRGTYGRWIIHHPRVDERLSDQ